MNEQWIQQLRQIMDGYQRPAPEVSWDEIDQALAAGKTHKTRQLWLQRMAAAAAILLIAGAGYWGFKHTETEQIPQTVASVEENHKEKSHDSNPNQDPTPMIDQPAPMTLAISAKASNISVMISVCDRSISWRCGQREADVLLMISNMLTICFHHSSHSIHPYTFLCLVRQ